MRPNTLFKISDAINNLCRIHETLPSCEIYGSIILNMTIFTIHCTDEQHAMSSHELQSALMLTAEFSRMHYTR
jgi:hypothetical protein